MIVYNVHFTPTVYNDDENYNYTTINHKCLVYYVEKKMVNDLILSYVILKTLIWSYYQCLCPMCNIANIIGPKLPIFARLRVVGIKPLKIRNTNSFRTHLCRIY